MTDLTFKLKLDTKGVARMKAWIDEQDHKVAARQSQRYPNYGSCGGAYTYSFTPTSIGTVVKLTNDMTKESIDITNYDDF